MTENLNFRNIYNFDGNQQVYTSYIVNDHQNNQQTRRKEVEERDKTITKNDSEASRRGHGSFDR